MAKPEADHTLAIIKAALSTVPVVGGPIASLIGDYVPTSTERAKQRAFQMLKERLEVLESEGRIDPDAVDKEEFAELFKSAYLAIVRTHREEKLRAAVELIANLLLRPGDSDKLSYTELDHFSRCVENLSGGAIEVLGNVYALYGHERRQQHSHRNPRFDFGNLRGRHSDVDPDLLMGLVGELNAHNLVHLTGAPAARTPEYGNYPIELTPLGIRFVERLLCKSKIGGT